jgi:hypothetical protein
VNSSPWIIGRNGRKESAVMVHGCMRPSAAEAAIVFVIQRQGFVECSVSHGVNGWPHCRKHHWPA